MSNYGLCQLVPESTHILDPLSACTDLIFTPQSNCHTNCSSLATTSKSSSSDNFRKTKFNLFIFYPPPYKKTAWYYEKKDSELIQFHWLRALSNANVGERGFYFTKTLFDIILNFIPGEQIFVTIEIQLG